VLALAVPVLIVSPSSAIPARRVAWGTWTRRTPLDLALLLFFVVHLTGSCITVDPELSWIALKCAVLKLVLFYAMVNHVRSSRALNVVTVLLLGAGLAAGVLGALGSRSISYRLFSLPSLPLGIAKIAALNPEGFNKNIWGGTVAMAIPLGFSLLLARPGWQRVAFGALTLCLTALCVLSQSRGALLAASLAIWAIFLLRSRWALLSVPAVAVGVVLALQRWGGTAIADFLLSSEALGGWESRMEVWSRALYMIQDFPYTGIGLGTFSRVAPVLYPFFLISPDAVVPHAHQLFLQTAVDVGIPGLVAYLAALILFVGVSWETFRLSRGREWQPTQWQPLAHGLFGSFVVYLGHGFFDYITFSTKPATLIWTAMGLMVALWGYLRRSGTSSGGGARERSGDGEKQGE